MTTNTLQARKGKPADANREALRQVDQFGRQATRLAILVAQAAALAESLHEEYLPPADTSEEVESLHDLRSDMPFLAWALRDIEGKIEGALPGRHYRRYQEAVGG